MNLSPLISRCKRDYDGEDNDENGDRNDTNQPEQASTANFLFGGGLNDLLFGLDGVLECRPRVLVHLNDHVSLFIHLSIYLLGDLIDVCHEGFHGIELFLAILQQIGHFSRFNLKFDLLTIELLLLKKLRLIGGRRVAAN